MKAHLLYSWTLTEYTFKELLGERILYNLFFVSIFLLFFGYLAALLVFGYQDRVMLHFGTFVNALSMYAVSAGAGSRVLRNEIEQRTCYLALSRPISRVSYFFGKWAGVALFAALNLSLLTAILVIGLRITGGHENLAFFQSAVLIWVETLMVTALAILSSLVLRPGLTMMVTLAYLFLSHNHEQIDFLMKQGSDGAGLFSLIKWLTPNGEALLLDTRVYYDAPLSLHECFGRVGYGCLWTLLFLLVGNALFYRKSL